MTISPSNQNPVQQAAIAYVKAGLSVLPTGKDKIPLVKGWKNREKEIVSEAVVNSEFANNGRCVAIIGGKVSGNLECIDHDFGGKWFTQWMDLVDKEAPGLIDSLVIQVTQNGGYHCVYRCDEPIIEGNQKLASEGIEVEGPGEHGYQGKNIKAVKRNGKHYIIPCYIETRGEGGYFLSYPSEGYKIHQNKFSKVPTITTDQRNILISAAKALNQWIPELQKEPTGPKHKQDGLSPGDDFNMRGDIPGLLMNHGWTPTGRPALDGELWRRPGKNKAWSANLFNNHSLYVWSTNAPPFEPETSYSPLAIYTLLEHSGDYKAAIKELARQDYGEKPKQSSNEKKSKSQKTEKKDDKSFLKKIEGMDAATLMGLEFPEPNWIIDEILPEGTFIFGGKPKAGKSVFALNLCLAVATGGAFLGKHVIHGNVLYLHLEDHHRRIQRRLNKMLPVNEFSLVAAAAPPNLHLYNKWPKIGEGGLRALDYFIGKNQIKLLIIDTFKRFHADLTTKDQKKNQYEIDYERLIPITEIAEKHQTTIGGIVHNRKMSSEDPMDLISGTLGNAGAVDTICVFYNRKGARARLYVQGRDVEQEDYTLEYAPDIWTWQMLGKTSGVMANDSQQAVMDYLTAAHSINDTASIKDIVDATGLKKANVKSKVIPALLASGLIIKAGYNQYYAPI